MKHYNAALESRHAKGNDTLRMELLHRMISCYDGLHDEVNKMRCTGQLMELAKKLGDKPMESIALFNMGKSLHYQGDKKRGYRYMEQGAEMMAATDYRLKFDNLRYEYKTLVMFYERDGDSVGIHGRRACHRRAGRERAERPLRHADCCLIPFGPQGGGGGMLPPVLCVGQEPEP